MVEEQTRVKNRLHALLNQSHPGYAAYFNEPFGKTALAFWERYSSPATLQGVGVKELGDFLREQSHFSLGYKQAERILSHLPDQTPALGYQRERDHLIQIAVRELRSLEELLRSLNEQLGRLVGETDYSLSHIPGIEAVMSAELISLVGDVTRFPSVDQFLAYTGIAPVVMGTGNKETRLRSKFGRRELLARFHRIASTQLVVHRGTGVPRNPEAKAYYEKRLGDQAKLPKEKQDRKTRKKALLSLMRQQAIRFYKLMKAQKLEAMQRRAGAGAEAVEGSDAA